MIDNYYADEAPWGDIIDEPETDYDDHDGSDD